MNINLKDNFIIGMLIGILGPALGIVIFFYVNFPDSEITQFLQLSVKSKLMSPLLSLCCVINLALFYLFVQRDIFKTSRGIILATFLYGFIIAMIKFML